MNMKKALPFLFIFLSILCFSCKDNAVGPIKPSWTLEDAFSIAGQDANLKCLIVYKDNHIIKEQYFHPGDSSSAHDVRSVTKSVMATLIGIAIDKGYIPSENQTIGDYIRLLIGSIDSNKARIKLRDVLSMSSGLAVDELVYPQEYSNWFNAANQVFYTFYRPLGSQPGQTFKYNSGAAHLTSAILTEVIGMSTFKFARQYLFQPLGIEDHSWETDKQGNYNGGAGLTLTPYDMLKLGQLYLNKGIYNGVRVVSEEWIKKATTFKITTNGIEPFGPSYGYFWWLGSTKLHGYYFANGWGGQFIFVVPDLNLIVVATNTWANVATDIANQQWYSTQDVIINKIIPLYE
jgi:CubicO group peptidase (beta-lactamase class C family)